ncbi:LysR substrate-binding domain-containing protein [Labrys sp. KNU-23]|uniref:LysR substrate-binding domain-containing protein n=1 Tax=Labrys sp. KNU-23 TaxID=2789216 RepID=UPI00165CBCED|nr:LysR substrate-binding domain-containing protein [Labrys sp. KNU-23]
MFEDALGIVCRADAPASRKPRSGHLERGAKPHLSRQRHHHTDRVIGVFRVDQQGPITVYNILPLLALVRAGVGITVLPRLSIPASETGIHFVALDAPTARRSVGLIPRSSERSSPATDAFARVLRRAVRMRADELNLAIHIRDNGDNEE